MTEAVFIVHLRERFLMKSTRSDFSLNCIRKSVSQWGTEMTGERTFPDRRCRSMDDAMDGGIEMHELTKSFKTLQLYR